MPTYSYRCSECANAFDIHQAFTDDTLTVCPVCGGKLRKVFSAIGVTFSGSGFYRTDSRSTPASAGGPSSDSSGSASSTAPQKESAKPASTTSSPGAGG